VTMRAVPTQNLLECSCKTCTPGLGARSVVRGSSGSGALQRLCGRVGTLSRARQRGSSHGLPRVVVSRSPVPADKIYAALPATRAAALQTDRVPIADLLRWRSIEVGVCCAVEASHRTELARIARSAQLGERAQRGSPPGGAAAAARGRSTVASHPRGLVRSRGVSLTPLSHLSHLARRMLIGGSV